MALSDVDRGKHFIVSRRQIVLIPSSIEVDTGPLGKSLTRLFRQHVCKEINGRVAVDLLGEVMQSD